MGHDLFRVPDGAHSRLSSFENLNGGKGQGGMMNKGAKGSAFEYLPPGKSRTLLDVIGAGIVTRMWFTIADRSPAMLRSLRLQMFWDHSDRPAVDVPFGDFFGAGLGRCVAFQSALMTNPRGRSFHCVIPMPYQDAARIVLINECADLTAQFFFDISFTALPEPDESALHFHAFWSRQRTSELGEDFEFLPTVEGKGRYLGVNFGVNRSPDYPGTGIEEGEIRVFLDGDMGNATIHGTGAEDYIGDGWGMGVFQSPYQGCTVADDATNEFCFYRQHVPDPIYFHRDIRASIQQMGGGRTDLVRRLRAAGARLLPVTVGVGSSTMHLLDMETAPVLEESGFPEGWVNFYRVDDWSATAYFYLNSATNQLPPLPPVSERL